MNQWVVKVLSSFLIQKYLSQVNLVPCLLNGNNSSSLPEEMTFLLKCSVPDF